MTEYIKWCTEQHDIVCNQKYDDIIPYLFHLKKVLEL